LIAKAMIHPKKTRPVKPTILLVDDDSAIRRFVSVALDHNNFSITTAASAEEALPFLARDEFDLVITDFRMPGKSGEAVVNAVREKRPDAKVILMTGLRHEMPEWLRLGRGGIPVLDKPFSIADLRDEVRRAFGAGNGAACAMGAR
jgi:DNA-binding NtrC family response regulator